MTAGTIRLAAASAAFAIISTVASATTLTNGDFSSGTLAGWTVTPTTNGTTRVQDVISFNTTGTGASNAAHFNVGRINASVNGTRGIVFSQSFVAVAGQYSFSVDVAARGGNTTNASGGIFNLFAGSTLIDSVDFGSISANTTERDTLSGVVTLAAGLSSFRLEILRPFTTTGNTPNQFVDNAVVIAPALVPVPLPAGLPLLIGGLVAFAMMNRKRTA